MFSKLFPRNVTFTIHTTPRETFMVGAVLVLVDMNVSKFQNWFKEDNRQPRFAKKVRKNEISFYLSSIKAALLKKARNTH